MSEELNELMNKMKTLEGKLYSSERGTPEYEKYDDEIQAVIQDMKGAVAVALLNNMKRRKEKEQQLADLHPAGVTTIERILPYGTDVDYTLDLPAGETCVVKEGTRGIERRMVSGGQTIYRHVTEPVNEIIMMGVQR